MIDLSTPVYTHEFKTIVPVLNSPTAIDTNYRIVPDSITVITNERLKAGPVKEALLGKNYREEWTEPIKVPVLDIGKEAGGIRPVRQSGGGQLRVLTLEDKKGKQWQLLSIERFPQNIIPSDLRTRIDINRKDDAMSASYPFASIIVSELQKAARIPSPRRKLVYVPDDPRLSRFKNDFKNSLAILEEREPLGVMKTIDHLHIQGGRYHLHRRSSWHDALIPISVLCLQQKQDFHVAPTLRTWSISIYRM